jgi:hypothetical protein
MKPRVQLNIVTTPRDSDADLDELMDNVKDLLSSAGFDIRSVTAEEFDVVTTWGCGEEYTKNEFGMWAGPFKKEVEALNEDGRSEMSCIVIFDPKKDIPEVTHRWSNIAFKWIPNAKEN